MFVKFLESSAWIFFVLSNFAGCVFIQPTDYFRSLASTSTEIDAACRLPFLQARAKAVTLGIGQREISRHLHLGCIDPPAGGFGFQNTDVMALRLTKPRLVGRRQ